MKKTTTKKTVKNQGEKAAQKGQAEKLKKELKKHSVENRESLIKEFMQDSKTDQPTAYIGTGYLGQLLGISRYQIIKMCKEGKLKAYHPYCGETYRQPLIFKVSDIRLYLTETILSIQ